MICFYQSPSCFKIVMMSPARKGNSEGSCVLKSNKPLARGEEFIGGAEGAGRVG